MTLIWQFWRASPLDTVICWELAQQLASNAGRDVDLVDLLKASTVLRMQVVTSGERFFFASESDAESFEDLVFSGLITLYSYADRYNTFKLWRCRLKSLILLILLNVWKNLMLSAWLLIGESLKNIDKISK